MAKTIGSFDLASLKNLRDDVTQYFWFESNSSSAWGSGAHVTLYPESQFTNPSHANYMKGQNIIMNTDGFSIRNGGLPMMVLDNDSLDFYVVDTTEGTYTKTATFTSTNAQIGQTGKPRITLNNSQVDIYDDSSTPRLTVKTDGLYFWENQASLLFLNAGESWNDVCLNGNQYCGAVLGMPKSEMLANNTTSGAHVAITPKNVSGREPYVRFMLKTSDLDNEYYSVLKYGMYQELIQDEISTHTTLDVDGDIKATGALFANNAEFSKQASNHIVIGGIHVCWGDVSISCTANTYTQTTVTLPYTYTNAPHVFTSFASQNANARTTYGTNGGDLPLNKIHVGALSLTTRSQVVCWMTIGV